MIRLTDLPIDVPAVVESVRSQEAGAVVLFLGTTRRSTDGRKTLWLDYECYNEMAEKELSQLVETARARWPLEDCAVVHRVGRVDVGQPSVAIAVSSPHRQPAFEAGTWLIDRIKDVVPIWKQEHWEDGTSGWVHPGLDGTEPPQ